MVKQVLGKGLGALLGGTQQKQVPVPITPTQSQHESGSPFSAPSETVVSKAPQATVASVKEDIIFIPIGKIKTSSVQPRKDFTQESINELAESIKQKGVLQPLIVRRRGEEYELISGERRWRASQIAGLETVPAIVRDVDDRTALEIALIENLQRENLNPIEEAEGYARLIESFNLTQEEAAVKVGKNRATVANALRLLKLPSDIQALLRKGNISAGHAKAILSLENSQLQKIAAEKVIKESLSVRQTEDLVNYLLKATESESKTGKKKKNESSDAHIVDLERQLMQKFGTKVSLRYREGKGALEIKFFSNEDLERILNIIGVNLD
ncbi:MAG: ParB/RepB/Spo0J family partition protein [Verrucomicrobiae bacterium]|nr:ParB/RepB/Spo0J family partition protein [Verrucomicrobiae bacterium]